jgi:hypothetical protein
MNAASLLLTDRQINGIVEDTITPSTAVTTIAISLVAPRSPARRRSRYPGTARSTSTGHWDSGTKVESR